MEGLWIICRLGESNSLDAPPRTPGKGMTMSDIDIVFANGPYFDGDRQLEAENFHPCAWQCGLCGMSFLLEKIEPTPTPEKCNCGSTDIRVSQWAELHQND